MTCSSLRAWIALLATALAAACSAPPLVEGDGAPPDADAAREADAPDDRPAGPCARDYECADGVFCNGVERCDPTARGADARGCAPAAAPPCLEGQTCSEARRRCESECDRTGDADGDGHRALNCPGGDDCDDADPLRFPGRTEVCDERDRDEDCDPRTYGARDADGDRHNDAVCCNTDPVTNQRACGDDCDDRRATVNPANPEVCDGEDNNCNGMVDERVERTFYPDADGDGYGDARAGATTRRGCLLPAGYAESGTDCNDAARAVHPGAGEVCNDVDDDCDGMLDEDVPGVGEACGTGTPGVCNAGVRRCRGASGAACVAVAAASVEVCDGLDNDCDGVTDENDPGGGASCSTGRPGVCASGVQHCQSGALRCVGDLAPGAEVCDARDNDCDGMVDEGVQTAFYPDSDGDGRGDERAAAVLACAAPTGRVANSRDCNDADGRVNRDLPELCDDVDNDCDGMVDEGVRNFACYRDADGDGFPSAAMTAPTFTCGGCPAGFTTRNPSAGPADCDDANAAAYPGQTLYFTTPRAGGSYDYDCNTTIERSGPTIARAGCSSLIACDSTPFWRGSAPACGEAGTIERCVTTAALLCVSGLEEMTRRGCR